MKARTDCENEGVGRLDSIITNNPSPNIVQMVGFSFEYEQNEASWLNPLTTLILSLRVKLCRTHSQ